MMSGDVCCAAPRCAALRCAPVSWLPCLRRASRACSRSPRAQPPRRRAAACSHPAGLAHTQTHGGGDAGVGRTRMREEEARGERQAQSTQRKLLAARKREPHPVCGVLVCTAAKQRRNAVRAGARSNQQRRQPILRGNSPQGHTVHERGMQPAAAVPTTTAVCCCSACAPALSLPRLRRARTAPPRTTPCQRARRGAAACVRAARTREGMRASVPREARRACIAAASARKANRVAPCPSPPRPRRASAAPPRTTARR
jgi:hypothetical protein